MTTFNLSRQTHLRSGQYLRCVLIVVSFICTVFCAFISTPAGANGLDEPLRIVFVAESNGPVFLLEMSTQKEESQAPIRATLVWLGQGQSFSRFYEDDLGRGADAVSEWPPTPPGLSLQHDSAGKALLSVQNLGDWQKGFLPAPAASEKVRLQGPPVVVPTSARVWFGGGEEVGARLAHSYLGPATLVGSSTAFNGVLLLERGATLENSAANLLLIGEKNTEHMPQIPGEILAVQQECQRELPSALFRTEQNGQGPTYSQILIDKPECVKGKGLVARVSGRQFSGERIDNLHGLVVIGMKTHSVP
jgi:hypothetical protein